MQRRNPLGESPAPANDDYDEAEFIRGAAEMARTISNGFTDLSAEVQRVSAERPSENDKTCAVSDVVSLALRTSDDWTALADLLETLARALDHNKASSHA